MQTVERNHFKWGYSNQHKTTKVAPGDGIVALAGKRHRIDPPISINEDEEAARRNREQHAKLNKQKDRF